MLARLTHIERYLCRECGTEYRIHYSDKIPFDQTYRKGLCKGCEKKIHEGLSNEKVIQKS